MQQTVVEVCLNDRGPQRPSCMASGSRELLKELKVTIPAGTKAKPTTCMGYCDRAVACRITMGDAEPIMVVHGNAQKVMDALGAIP